MTDEVPASYREPRSHRKPRSSRQPRSAREQQAQPHGAYHGVDAQPGPRPVFLDRSGRRRRLVVLVGVGLAVLLIAGLGVLLIGLTGPAGLHVPGFPDQAAPGANATPSQTPGPGEAETRTEAGPVVPAGGTSASPTDDRSSPRRIPTQTPSHDPKPSKP
jgi:hypothetical protein